MTKADKCLEVRLFTLKKNPAIEDSVGLESMQVIATTEQQAREIADQAASSRSLVYQSRDSGIVGVTVSMRVVWDHPFLRPHLTLCEQSEIPIGIVQLQSKSALLNDGNELERDE